MPSDPDPTRLAGTALAGAGAPFHEGANAAAEEVRALVVAARERGGSERTPALAASLGQLGTERLDIDRLAPLFGSDRQLPTGPSLEAVEAALAVLREVAALAEPPVLRLSPGEDLGYSVERELARLGRAFGAAHVVAAARSGRYQRTQHAGWLESYPFARWNRQERLLAPPLVVELDGAELRPGGLASLLDGRVRIALVVRDSSAPPAPLVRLISPGVLVIQATDQSDLDRLSGYEGPGVLAWVPTGCAAFRHDPSAGPTLASRLQVTAVPAPPARGLGGLSAAQLAEEIRQLEALAGLGAAQQAISGASANPADRLAAWILSQADLSGNSGASA